MPDPLSNVCTVCSAAIGEPCRDRQFRVIAPHLNRVWITR